MRDSLGLRRVADRWPSINVSIILLLLGALLFLYMAYNGLRSLETLDSHQAASRQALQNSILISETLSLIKDVETGQRGFVITGDEIFLVPYLDARDRFDRLYQQLVRNLDSSDQDGRSAHENLKQLVQQRIQHAALLIEERRERGASVLDDLALYIEGRRIMDEIRLEAAMLQEEQQSVNNTRIDLSRRVQAGYVALSYWIAIGGTFLMIISAIFLVREKRIRDRVHSHLNYANAYLESRVKERTEKLRSAHDRIQTFAMELDQNVEAERRRLAREVHDQVGQIFTSIKMLLHCIGAVPHEERKAQLAELNLMLDEGVAISRRITSELRPALLDDLGLSAAITYYTDEVKRRGGPLTRVEINQDDLLSPTQANQLFRITQEAVTNVVRHAKAGRILIEGGAQDKSYRLTVTDDGVGPQPIRADASGVRNMRERAALVGGTFEFGAVTERGTRILVTIPLDTEGGPCAA